MNTKGWYLKSTYNQSMPTKRVQWTFFACHIYESDVTPQTLPLELAAFLTCSLHFKKLPWYKMGEVFRQIWSSGGSNEFDFAVWQWPGALHYPVDQEGKPPRTAKPVVCACSQASVWVDKTEFVRDTGARITTVKNALGFLLCPVYPFSFPNSAFLAVIFLCCFPSHPPGSNPVSTCYAACLGLACWCTALLPALAKRSLGHEVLRF